MPHSKSYRNFETNSENATDERMRIGIYFPVFVLYKNKKKKRNLLKNLLAAAGGRWITMGFPKQILNFVEQTLYTLYMYLGLRAG